MKGRNRISVSLRHGPGFSVSLPRLRLHLCAVYNWHVRMAILVASLPTTRGRAAWFNAALSLGKTKIGGKTWWTHRWTSGANSP